MKDDVFKLINASRPAELAGDGRMDSELRRIELNRAFAQPRRAPSGRRGRKWLLVPAAAAGLAGATAVALVATSGGAATPHGPRLQAGSSNQSIFLAAATSAERQPMGNYWRSDTVWGQTYLVRAKTGTYAITGAPSEYFQWTATKSSGGSRFYGRDLPARPISAADVAAWKRAGSPDSFRVWSNDHYETYGTHPSEAWTADVPESGGQFFLAGANKKNVTVEYLENLPTDPAKLAALLFSPRSTSGPRGVPTDKLLAVSSNLESDPIPPKVRAGMMRMLAAQPGIRSIGTVTDPFGRSGVAIAVDPSTDKTSKAFGYTASEEIVFDQKTGAFLAEQEILVKPGGIYAQAKPGTVLSYEAARASGWTKTQPAPPRPLPLP